MPYLLAQASIKRRIRFERDCIFRYMYMHRLEKIGSEFSLTSLRTLFATTMLQMLKGIDTILRVKNAVSLCPTFDFVIKNKVKQSRPRDTAAGKNIKIVRTVFSFFLPP